MKGILIIIISKTPLRISLFSGGSDLPSFFINDDDGGAALSATIDKYIYIMVHKTHNGGIRLKFDTVEEIDNINEMQHTLTKETLNHWYGDITKYSHLNGWEISSISDVSYRGTGLGSSSAFVVGLLNTIIKSGLGPEYLAIESCKVEIDRCNYPVGKQDSYSAAYGGFNLFRFYKNGTVSRNSVKIPKDFNEKLILIYSGISRNANDILKSQVNQMIDKEKFKRVQKNRDRAYKALDFLELKDYDSFGSLLNDSWQEKKQIATGVSNEYFDDIYNTAIEAGSLGGKILGAGGGGYMIMYASSFNVKDRIMHDLKKFDKVKELKFNFSNKGSEVILNDKMGI